ncbi:MAG TPA: sigma-70 family RNA polymerase sigma factor [Candidatus Limnocylindrales bacterium]
MSASGGADADDREFEMLYAAAWSPVYRYSLTLVRDLDDAADVAAETFRRAFVAWRAGKGAVAEPLPWLFLTARRIVVDRERRNRLVRWLPLTNAAADAADNPLSRTELWLWFRQLCEALPDRQREALVLRYGFDMSDEDIGRLIGVSPAGVHTLVSRALSRLRAQPEIFE